MDKVSQTGARSKTNRTTKEQQVGEASDNFQSSLADFVCYCPSCGPNSTFVVPRVTKYPSLKEPPAVDSCKAGHRHKRRGKPADIADVTALLLASRRHSSGRQRKAARLLARTDAVDDSSIDENVPKDQPQMQTQDEESATQGATSSTYSPPSSQGSAAASADGRRQNVRERKLSESGAKSKLLRVPAFEMSVSQDAAFVKEQRGLSDLVTAESMAEESAKEKKKPEKK